MLGWWKRNDGFEWHKYVRTTIALRRTARRERAERLKRQAAESVKAAGHAAGAAARGGARGLGSGSRVVVSRAASGMGVALALARPAAGMLGSALQRVGGRVWEALIRVAPRRISHRVGLGCVAAVAALASAYLVWSGQGKVRTAGLLPSLPFTSKTVSGRGSVLGPGLLRVGTTPVRLGGIEAPEREQVCTRAGRRWRCGEAALATLARLAAGRSLECEVRGVDSAGHAVGICLDKETDIGAALVRGGHVFATPGLLSRYGRVEAEAKAAKAGLWSGESELPEVWRARVWEDARKRRPDGCPIKGQVTGGARLYVLPSSAEYERVRVNLQRGGRWFCSEKEAIDAGWKLSARG